MMPATKPPAHAHASPLAKKLAHAEEQVVCLRFRLDCALTRLRAAEAEIARLRLRRDNDSCHFAEYLSQ